MEELPKDTEEGTMMVVLKLYINRLAATERSKPVDKRKRVPSMEELAKTAGIHPATLSNIANNNIRQLNLETGGRIIAAMRQFGFPMTVNDLIEYRGPDVEPQ